MTEDQKRDRPNECVNWMDSYFLSSLSFLSFLWLHTRTILARKGEIEYEVKGERERGEKKEREAKTEK